jgi:aminoglycoside phosphotransferase (APT) family kinase protein
MHMPQQSSDVAPVRAGEELDWERLKDYLSERLPTAIAGADSSTPNPEPRTPNSIDFAQFPGGHSNLTYLVKFDGREFVLRRPPVGPVAPTAHDMPREYRMLAAINPVFPLAPKPYLLCEDASIIGVPFYLMERRRGVIVRRDVPTEIGDDLSLRRRVSESLVDTLAALHSVDINKHGLDKLGKPAGFVSRQVKGWSERWERAKTGDVPQLERVIEWLRVNLPPEPERATLLHNDYKLDNVMLDASDPSRVVAILDWEMSAVGDPLVDLGIMLCYWPQADDPPVRRTSISAVTAQPGWLSRAEITARYAAKTGFDVSRIAFYEAFALFKVAVVVQQIYYRYHVGQTRDSRFAEFDKIVAALAAAAWGLIENADGYLCLNEAGRPKDLV